MLVIGYGSDLRRDDAAGRRVADAVAACALPDVEVRSLVQLTPELAADMAGRDLVVFVDATVGVDAVGVDHVMAPPGHVTAAPTTHHLDPRGLLALCQLFGDPPVATVVVSVPARDLGIGTGLHPGTEDDVARATLEVLGLLRGRSPARDAGR